MTTKQSINVERFIKSSRRARIISGVGLAMAFLASALSILTANASSTSEKEYLLVLTIILWVLAFLGMGMWIIGRKEFRKASAQGGWLAQTANAPGLGSEWGGWIVLFTDPVDAEQVYGRAVRSLREKPAGFPVRIDLSWLNGDNEMMQFAAAFFYPLGEENNAVARLNESAKEWTQTFSSIQILSGEGARELYFQKFQGCGSSMWLE
ncbi:MAG: hypothetical protein JXA25_01270 [Anaerolineales bacterium]|nr:hypothetical protein [Anaerolineales bacterium]